MHSSLIGKIQKAHQYAEEPERIGVTEFCASFHGDHDNHVVRFDSGHWHCSCAFFSQWGTCSHIMAVQRVLGVIAPHDSTEGAVQVANAI